MSGILLEVFDGAEDSSDAAVCAGLQLVLVTFSNSEKPNRTLQVGIVDIMIHGRFERVNVLSFIYNKYPNIIVVDYTISDAMNGNDELYCKLGVPFIMATTGADRELLHKTIRDANVYAVISP
ncbi:putative 4-hydroxy-tetrahydrodipicolinate reductase 1, chloroplastic [Dendrobium catenatum]|uniref:Putative 4-hydroxy-tetrahydrodipicolinate reductase 1, chloroplastic n=1 Tax=Dendrobium catenatum TaxID=906689 RepID=A0A2I0WDK6_9ASPA|nr:putative 4-hydroxy-tetrahydrodipicolinate reductase 1, chloroplastic [Dendrobium catenatum]